MRHLVDRLDDSRTGDVIKELETELPAYAKPEAKKMAALFSADLANKYKMQPGV